MGRRRLQRERELYEGMPPEDQQEWILLQIATDLREIKGIVVAWWWLFWIGVAVTMIAAITASGQ